MTFGLVAATIAHAAVMATVHASAFPAGETWDRTTIATLLGQPGVFGLMDVRGGMVLARRAADEAEVLTLAVQPALRGRGIGAGLLAAAMQQAAGLGAKAMFLEVSETNAAARRLYARAGFAPAGLRRSYYADGASALVLRKPLGPVAT